MQTIQLSNQRLRFPLTKTAWNRLNSLISRWSMVFGSSSVTPDADLEPPDAEEKPGPLRPSNRILEDLDEHAFASSRSEAL